MPSSHHQEQTRSKMKVTLTWKTVEMAGQMPSKWSCKDTLVTGKINKQNVYVKASYSSADESISEFVK